jgi:starch-binding outer membrane protein, SusD/RagB family
MTFSASTRARRFWRAGAALAVPAAVLVAVPACTDLTEAPTSAITPGNFYRTPDEILGGLASVYAGLRGSMWGYYNLSQVTTDENIVPTRGSDWFDNGRWLEMYRQRWSPTSGSGLDDIAGVWNDMFGGVSRANVVLNALENVDVPNKAQVQAELRFLRAFYYYTLMDMFGGVPIVTDNAIQPRERATRAAVFQFIETELNAARPALLEVQPASGYGRVTRGAADALLANMYLNARVYTGTVTTAGLQPGTARWQEAVTAADRVLNSGRYSLASNFQGMFSSTNSGNSEHIFVVRHRAQAGLGLSIPMRMNHYNAGFSGDSPWNGWATLAETYATFDSVDVRRRVFLAGQQFNLRTGEPVRDRNGALLIYTPIIRDPSAASESEGVRLAKYTADPNAVGGGNHANDFVYFRLGEMIMIKAEALNELGQTAQAITEINRLRARGFPNQPAKLLASTLTQAQVRAAIYNERLFEFAGEAKRRQDMVRFGTYTGARAFKTAGEPYRILMPIPQTQIDINPLLVQNAGY